MSVEEAIKRAEAFKAEQDKKKEADRIAKLKPEEIQAEEAKKAEAAKTAEDRAVLEAKDETLDEAGKKRKSELIESQKKRDAENNERILKAKDEELTEEEKPKKADLLRKQKEDQETAKEAKIQSRIDEIAGELKAEKALRNKDQEKVLALETELKKLKGITEAPQIESQVQKLEQDRISKYLESDKNLPIEQRREMSKKDLEEWIVEDIAAAQEWLADRAVRRDKEKTADKDKLSKKGNEDLTNQQAEAVIKRQRESRDRANQKYPDVAKQLDIKARMAELKSEGKTKKEIENILLEERPAMKIVSEILSEDEDTYLLAENGPELLAEEVTKRLGSSTKKAQETKRETQDERDARIAAEAVEAERERIANLPPNLKGNGGPKKQEEKLEGLQKEQWEIYKKRFPEKTYEDFKNNLARQAGR